VIARARPPMHLPGRFRPWDDATAGCILAAGGGGDRARVAPDGRSP